MFDNAERLSSISFSIADAHVVADPSGQEECGMLKSPQKMTLGDGLGRLESEVFSFSIAS